MAPYIENVLEESAIVDTLVAPLHSTYEQPTEELEGDQESAEQPLDAQQEPSGPESQSAANDELQATPEQLEAYAQEQQAWDSLPDEQKGKLADEHLQEAYDSAYGTITPQQAKEFTDAIGENWGIENLSGQIDPIPFAVFAETWSDHAQRTIALHPAGQEFLEAVATDPERAVHVALNMCDPVMSQRFFNHFQNVLGPHLFQGRSPMQLAAECMVDLARLQGLGVRRQTNEGEQPVGRDSPFRTNQDIFDNSTMEQFKRL